MSYTKLELTNLNQLRGLSRSRIKSTSELWKMYAAGGPEGEELAQKMSRPTLRFVHAAYLMSEDPSISADDAFARATGFLSQ